MIIKGGKKRSARSYGITRRQLPSVEKFWARKTPEIWGEGVGIFKYQYAVQSICLYEILRRLIQKALTPSPLVSA